MTRFAGSYQIIKIENRRLIGGYASIEVRDIQDAYVLVGALRDALTHFIEAKLYLNVHVMHNNVQVGKVIEKVVDSDGHTWTTHVDDRGIFVVCEIDRECVWDAIERGELTAFRIAGEAISRSGPNGENIDRLELHEITICGKDANLTPGLIIIKYESGKGGGETSMGKDECGMSDEELARTSWRELERRRYRIEDKVQAEVRLRAAIRAAIEGLRGLAATK